MTGPLRTEFEGAEYYVIVFGNYALVERMMEHVASNDLSLEVTRVAARERPPSFVRDAPACNDIELRFLASWMRSLHVRENFRFLV